MPNAFYAQSGGVTAVINASAAGVLAACRRYPQHIDRVFAGKNGILGALNEELLDTNGWCDDEIQSLCERPGGVFGSCRYKLGSIEHHRKTYERLVEVFRAHDIVYFFYNGGGDSADTCLKISALADQLKHPLQVIHIPKTIDNDLPYTDSCPGFGSVAKYVATSIREAAMDVRSMCATSTQVFILEVMGRHAGWITAACGLASDDDPDQAPHVLVFPEFVFDRERFMTVVAETISCYGYCVVAVSEGAKDGEGRFLSEHGDQDAFGHSQLGGVAPLIARWIKDDLGLKCHAGIADYLQRSARHIASRVDLEQAYAVGRAAVEFAVLDGLHAVMPTVERFNHNPYEWRVGSVSLDKVANVERGMPQSFIRHDGFHITDEARSYLLPLIQGEVWPRFEQGMPYYLPLKFEYVSQKCSKWV